MDAHMVLIRVAPPLGSEWRLQRDDANRQSRPFGRHDQRHRGPHRAAHNDRPFADHLFDEGRAPVAVKIRGQKIWPSVPIVRRQGFAMKRQVDCEETVSRGQLDIRQLRQILPPIRAGSVQEQNRRTIHPGRFEIDQMLTPADLYRRVFPGDLRDVAAHGRRLCHGGCGHQFEKTLQHGAGGGDRFRIALHGEGRIGDLKGREAVKCRRRRGFQGLGPVGFLRHDPHCSRSGRNKTGLAFAERQADAVLPQDDVDPQREARRKPRQLWIGQSGAQPRR